MLGGAAPYVLAGLVALCTLLWALPRLGRGAGRQAAAPQPQPHPPAPPRPDPRYGRIAERIEAELRRSGAWTDAPPSEEDVVAEGAFGGGTVPFEQWVQVVLLRRLRQVAAGEIGAPRGSQVGVYAWRELGHDPHRERLVELLQEVDRL